MASQSTISKTILANGVRILSERVPYVDSVSVGVWVHAGARDESRNRRGISHFVEHMLFKGTQKREARQIADEMDLLGGHLNAFTDKEFTCYYVRVLSEHLPRALDILSDMVLNSLLDPAEIEREKNVVIEEIKRHQDTPEDRVHDLLMQTLWNGHRLANPVIGSSAVVRGLTRDDLLSYLHDFYRPDALVISAAGKVDHAQFVDLVAAGFGGLNGRRPPRRISSVVPRPETRLTNKTTEQAHFCMGTAGFSQCSQEKYALAAIDSILGGGMSSRLFQEIREKRGLVYSIGSYSVSYTEAGMFAVYGGASIGNIDRVLEITRAECENIGRYGVTESELERARNQIRGALVLGQESMSNRMSRLAKSEMYFGRVVKLDEMISSIMRVSADDVSRVAAQVFDGPGFALVAIGPFRRLARHRAAAG